MVLETEKGDTSTEEVDEVEEEEEGDEEEQGAKRSRTTVAGDEAEQERKEVHAESEFHAKSWRLSHLGEGGQLQPKGRERGAEMAGDHTTSVDSKEEHIMVEGTESESLARVATSECDDQGRKLVYSSARMVVRLGPTPGYEPPVSDDSVRIEDGAPEGVVVEHHVPRYMS